MAQFVRASLPDLCRAKRPGFKPQIDHKLFMQTVYLPVLSIMSQNRPWAYGNGQNKLRKAFQPFLKSVWQTSYNNMRMIKHYSILVLQDIGSHTCTYLIYSHSNAFFKYDQYPLHQVVFTTKMLLPSSL